MWQTTLHSLPYHKIASWAVRGLLIAVSLRAMVHRRGYTVIGAPQEVQTEHPITCVHTRLTDEVEEWKIQRTLIMAREMGATTITEFFPWPYIEPQEGQYTWTHSDQIVKHARAQGLRVIARIGMVPGWAQPDDPELDRNRTLNHLEPEHFEDFARFLANFAEHYKGEVDHIIVWNEPNLAYEWGYQKVVPANYVKLLETVYPVVHEANPDVVILAGALAPTLEPVGSPFGMNEIDYLRQFYEAGGQGTFDALAVHTYGFKFPAEEPPAPDVLNFRRIELLREIMVEYGDGDKPVYVTESGWNDHPRWTKAVRPGQRIAYTIDGLKYAEDHWPWLEAECIWAMRYPAPTHSFPDYFTLVSPDFTPKPIYEEIQRWARGWDQETAP